MGYFWLNSNSKWRATLSPQFERLTKGCEQVEVAAVHGWEWNVYLSGLLYMAGDAFSGQHKRRRFETSEQAVSEQGGSNQSWRKPDSVHLFTEQQLNSKLLIFNNSPQRQWWASSNTHILCLCVFSCKLTDFPVPGFQWYPNTSSRLTVLLCSTCFSSSSWEEKVRAEKYMHRKPETASWWWRRNSNLPWIAVGSGRARGNH